MARPSKTQFAIYEDSGIPTQECRDPFANEQREKDRTVVHEQELEIVIPSIEESVANIQPTDTEVEHDGGVSEMPESDHEEGEGHSLPHSMIRPSFRRHLAGSPFERSPKRSGLHPKSRTTTPRSVRTNARGSPLPRKHLQEEATEAEKKDYPLVLLHITVLPVELRWSAENMREILPPSALENLQLLKSKLSETILQRGILIPHPREEYDLLEERLLEALELKPERITKCGHFRARESLSSVSSAEESVSSGDSGMGSSIEDLCAICHHHVGAMYSKSSSRHEKWSIKVFASNGLMRASAWSAAWSEMERVDVEIIPWIDDSLCRLLDAKTAEEEAEKRLKQEESRIAHEQRERADDEEYQKHANATRQVLYLPQAPADEEAPVMPQATTTVPAFDDLPQVYRPKDIPLSLLLRNYIILLAQDTRNIGIFVLAVLVIWLGLSVAVRPSKGVTPLMTAVSNVSTVPVAPYENVSFHTPSTIIEPIPAAMIEPPQQGPSQSADVPLAVENGTNPPVDIVAINSIPTAEDIADSALEVALDRNDSRPQLEEKQPNAPAESSQETSATREASTPDIKGSIPEDLPQVDQSPVKETAMFDSLGACENDALLSKIFTKSQVA